MTAGLGFPELVQNNVAGEFSVIVCVEDDKRTSGAERVSPGSPFGPGMPRGPGGPKSPLFPFSPRGPIMPCLPW